VQGMIKVKSSNFRVALSQLHYLEESGAELVRLAIRDEEDLLAFRRLKEKARVPLVADVHFRSDLVLSAIEFGADKVRLNPGNITDRKRLEEIIKLAKKKKVAIRVGVNSGSLPAGYSSKDLEACSARKEGSSTNQDLASFMVSVAERYLLLFEAMDFHNIVVSLKSPSVPVTVSANRLFRQRFDYPLHLGITEAGRGLPAVIKSTAGIATLLEEGIGETIRVSLSGPPEEEVFVGKQILQSLELRSFYPEIISCPVCGRCQIDLFRVIREVEEGLKKLPGHPHRYAGLKIAVMGCEVNGPGEAAGADVGIAAGRKSGLLFVKGKVVAKIEEKELVKCLLREISNRGR